MKTRNFFKRTLPYLNNERGYILLLAILMSVTLFIALAGISNLSLSSLSLVKRSVFDKSADYAAESGIDNAVFQINSNAGYTGTNSVCPLGSTGENPVTLYSNSAQGKATYENCVTAGSISHELIVYSEGKVYRRTTDTSPISTHLVKAVVEGSQSGGYAVMVGPGGLIMSNGVTITNGPVSVGGYITMSNNSTIGSANTPVAVNVANARCPSPADSTYPQICGAGVQPNPITLSNNAHIYGAVTANGQTNSSGMSNTGLVASSGATIPSMPTYNRTAQKAAVTSTLTGANASCSGSSNVTWPANVHITGNVTLSNNCTITVSGNAWIDGNLSTSNNTIMTPASTVSTMPTVMVDGSSGISLSNNSKIATNASNIGIQFITYYSTAACSPNCATVTGTDLKNSQTVQTITLSNQGGGSGSTFEAMWTELTVSNGGTLGAVMAQTLQLSNNGNISFNSSSVGGTWSYDVRYYEDE
jgi:hypothetical protein